MARGQLKAGTNVGAAPRVYTEVVRAAVKRRYLTHMALAYHPKLDIPAIVASEFNLTANTVCYLLHHEGLR